MATHNGTMSLVEAAFQARLSYHQLYRLVLLGQVRGERVGTRWRIPTPEVSRLVKRQQAAVSRSAKRPRQRA